MQDGVCIDCARVQYKIVDGIAFRRSRYELKMATDRDFRKANAVNARRHYHRVMKHEQERMSKHYERCDVYQNEHHGEVNQNRRPFKTRNPGYGRVHIVARIAQIKYSDLTAEEKHQVRSIYKLR